MERTDIANARLAVFRAVLRYPSEAGLRLLEAVGQLTKDYSPDQPRDKNGRFAEGGGSISEKLLTSEGKSDRIHSSSKPSATGANKFENGFTRKNLDRHMERHGKEYPGFTAEQYNQYALDLIQQPVSNDVLGYLAKDGAVVRYRISTNDFVKGYTDGGIATLYKPKGNPEAGKEYYMRQMKKEGV